MPSGAPLAPALSLVRAALDDGALGLDAANLIATELGSVRGGISRETLDFAESLMVGFATGVDPSGQLMATTVSVDYLASEIRQVSSAVDPDGARPREERAKRRRRFRLGTADDDGLIPLSARLTPEVGLRLKGLLEASRRSPRFAAGAAKLATSDPITDDLSAAAAGEELRTPGQRAHDAFAELLMAVAASEGTAQLDGQAVCVIVTVSARDLEDSDGLAGDPIGTMAGSAFPVSRNTVERFIDGGGYRTVTLATNGSVTGISSLQRCFTHTQRMAIGGRDGFCCGTPGCVSPHHTLQVHHVVPARDGGPTSVENGILLCYWHHQQVDDGPWRYRMFVGVPHVRGPGVWEWMPLRKPVRKAA